MQRDSAVNVAVAGATPGHPRVDRDVAPHACLSMVLGLFETNQASASHCQAVSPSRNISRRFSSEFVEREVRENEEDFEQQRYRVIAITTLFV